MEESIPSIGARPRPSKARQFSRSPVLFASIQLGKNLNGFILNAGEGGLCVQTAREIGGEEPLELRFQSARPDRWVKARGRIVWTNEEKTVAGLEFVETTSEIVSEVRNWLAFGASLKDLRGSWWPEEPATGGLAREETSLDTNAVANGDTGERGGQQDRENAAAERAPLIETVVSAAASSPLPLGYDFGPTSTPGGVSKRRYPAGILAIAAAFLVLVVMLFGQQHGFVGRIRGILPKPWTAASRSLVPAQKPSATQSTADGQAAAGPELPALQAKGPEDRERSVPSAAPEPTAGLVLQVGAMSEAGNASRLVENLRAENFPAFVSKRNSGRFHFVLVGPYADVAALREAKKALGNKGYEAMERHWSSKE